MNFNPASAPPEHQLVIYGSLAPGRQNHHIVADIKGTYHAATIRGKLVQLGWGTYIGFNAFVPAPPSEASEIEAVVLYSEELPAHWVRIDDFEGEQYQRIIVPYVLADGTTGRGYLYAINEQVQG